MRRAAVYRIVVVLAGIAVASPAHAHLVETGFGDFYDGIAHVAVTPADLLVVVALALLAGQRGAGARATWHSRFPVAWLAGGLIGARWPSLSALPLLTTLVVRPRRRARRAQRRAARCHCHLARGRGGLLHGLANGATMAPAGVGGLVLGGAVSAIFFLTTSCRPKSRHCRPAGRELPYA